MTVISVGTVPNDIREDSVLSINTDTVTGFTHGFHKYPGKFIPQIPSWAIAKYLDNSTPKTVFDPFSGSGTTLVESLLRSHNTIGTDIDPLSVMISRVKTTPLCIQNLNSVYNWISKELNNPPKGENRTSCENINHWFSQRAIEDLSSLRYLIDRIPLEFENSTSYQNIQRFFYICFSSIIRRVSNADNQSQKTYVSHTKVKTPESVLPLFKKRMKYFKERIELFSKTVNPELEAKVYCTSSSDNLNAIIGEFELDLVVSSPPYIKAIDYVYNQMVELFWIGDLFGMETQTKQNKKKKQYIGTKQFKKIEYSKYDPLANKFDIDQLDLKIHQVLSNDDKNGLKHSYITFQYFTEMENHFQSISRQINSGVHYIMVVGNSSVSNIDFNTADYLVNLANRQGLELCNKWGYKIRNRYMNFNRQGRGGIIETDWVLDFVKI